METLKEGILKLYSGRKAFRAGSWKEDSDKLFTPMNAVEVWRKTSRYFPENSKDLIFISPSANVPTHEAAIWLHERRSRKGRLRFLVGDITDINPNEQIRMLGPLMDKGHQFTFFKWDAGSLPLRDESVDVIWDRKGWLWHCANNGSAGELRQAIDEYKRILKPRGCVVIDDMPWEIKYKNTHLGDIPRVVGKALSWLIFRRRFKPSEVFPNAYGEYESSTASKIRDKQRQVWKELNQEFYIDTTGNGITQVKVFRKLF